MHEALQAVIAEAFAPAINLHHLQAGGRPENRRSLAVLARPGPARLGWAGLGWAGLGFTDEGLARDDRYIDGT